MLRPEWHPRSIWNERKPFPPSVSPEALPLGSSNIWRKGPGRNGSIPVGPLISQSKRTRKPRLFEISFTPLFGG